MEKITKRDIYTALINFANGGALTYPAKEEGVDDGCVGMDELRAFAENEIALLDKKAEKAKETAKKKRKAADELQIALQGVLTDEFETIADLAAKLDDPDATVAKCVYRLNALVEAGVAEKTDIKIADAEGKKRTVKGYKLADVDTMPTDSVEE